MKASAAAAHSSSAKEWVNELANSRKGRVRCGGGTRLRPSWPSRRAASGPVRPLRTGTGRPCRGSACGSRVITIAVPARRAAESGTVSQQCHPRPPCRPHSRVLPAVGRGRVLLPGSTAAIRFSPPVPGRKSVGRAGAPARRRGCAPAAAGTAQPTRGRPRPADTALPGPLAWEKITRCRGGWSPTPRPRPRWDGRWHPSALGRSPRPLRGSPRQRPRRKWCACRPATGSAPW